MPGTAAPPSSFPVRRVVVPVGGTDREFLSQEHAVGMASALQAPLFGVHVRNDPDGAPADLFGFLEQHCERWGVELATQVLAGNEPGEVLLDELEPFDLVILGTRKLGRKYHVGSLAEVLVQRAPCPVQVVRLDA